MDISGYILLLITFIDGLLFGLAIKKGIVSAVLLIIAFVLASYAGLSFIPKIPEEFSGIGISLRNMESAIAIKDKLPGVESITVIGAGVLGTELFSLLSRKYKVKLISKHEYNKRGESGN